MLDWIKKTFGGEQPKTVGDVFEAYGALLERYPTAILDSSMLPMSKTKMKVMLKAQYAKALSLGMGNQFEVGFMFLSKFQDGVGPAPIDCTLSDGDPLANMNADQAKLDKWLSWERLSLVESEVLMAEWKRFKEGEPI